MLSLTVGGDDYIYEKNGFLGDINCILRPIHRGILQFVGFDVLEPHISYASVHMSNDERIEVLKKFSGICDNLISDNGEIKMKVKKCDFPDDSKIVNESITADFNDSYSVITVNNELDPLQIYLLMVNNTPVWINSLLSIRNKIIKLLGLKDVGQLGGVDYINHSDADELTGAKLDIFTIESFSENEMILILNDRHLNIKMSILKRKYADKTEVIVSTIVNFNNKLGSVYMFIISPFHRLVMMRLMNNVLNKNTNQKST